ncbi:potassium/sodium hyperpolarization-activated cyclic nucleotide-gated channel 2-like [Anoplophora glabripennis]|uniref:potassium/sodium hyperpolarization-activated cyclic nucleotide-gated channel 2-like n=1 Tax=Anoplophora glabripennis TaxID=217634 RepID=UPI000874FCB8|nr:potassium/sodium hyperpolarization-activated cyclic nucleotide-gated channel 2-like [Anoplophora glabripennis]
MTGKDHSGASRSLFARYGHDCTLENISDTYDWEEVPGTSLWSKFKRWIIRMIVVSEASKFYTHHLRSFGAITKERKRQLRHHKFRIHPFCTARIVWAIVMVIVIFLELIASPFKFLLCDNLESFVYTKEWLTFRMIMDTFLLLNIVINCLTGYYDEPMQEVVLDFKKILLHYSRTTLIVDVLCAIPVNWAIFFSLGQDVSVHIYFTWLLIFRFFLLIVFSKYFKTIADYFNINHYTYMTSMVFFYTFIFWHVMCCLITFVKFHLGEDNQLFSGVFLEPYQYSSKSNKSNVWEIYFEAIHRKSLILYNSGFGKDLPTNEYQIVLIYCVWYGSSLFCIFILAMIMEINRGRTSSAHKYDEMEKQLKEYMQHKQLPAQMKSKILTYYEFKYQKRYFRENEILATISEQLRQEMNLHACRKLVENVIFFRNLPLNLLVRIISCLRIEVYLVNDIIIRANTPGASMYFISTGTVAIYTKSGKEICHLEDGAHFGEVALIIKDTFRIATVIAVEVSEIYRLDQKDFVKAINPYPDLLANIQHIAAERMEVATMLDEYNKRELAMKRFNLIK